MSIGTLASLAVVRDGRPPTRGDVGTAAAGEQEAPAKYRDVLAAAIPTELVAAYTFLVTFLVGFVRQPTRRIPEPDQLLDWRWGLFVALVVFAVGGGLIVGFLAPDLRKERKVRRGS